MFEALRRLVAMKPKLVGYIADCWAYCPEHYRWLLDVMAQRHDKPEMVREVLDNDRTLEFSLNPGWMRCVRCGKKLVRYVSAFEKQEAASC